MKFSDINYAPLERLNKAFSEATRQFFKGKWGLVRIISIVVIILASILFAPGYSWLAVFFAATWFAKRVTNIKNQSWHQFADLNNWRVLPADVNQVPPGLRNIGHGHKMSEIIVAEFDNIKCDFFTYEYTVGHGKSSHRYFFTNVRTNLGEPFPHIVLDGNNYRDLNLLKGYKHLPLEGDFNKYFKLYLSPGQQIDVLSIITPDVMQTLISANQKQDIEIYGESLYFIGLDEHRTPEAFEILLGSVKALSEEMIHRAKSLNYQPQTAAKKV